MITIIIKLITINQFRILFNLFFYNFVANYNCIGGGSNNNNNNNNIMITITVIIIILIIIIIEIIFLILNKFR